MTGWPSCFAGSTAFAASSMAVSGHRAAEEDRRRRMAHDAGTGPEAKRAGLMLVRVEESDRSIEVIEAARYVASKGDARGQRQPSHLEADVVLLFREREARRRRPRLVELAAGQVKLARLAAPEIVAAPPPLRPRAGAPARRSPPPLVPAAGRHEASGETRVQGCLLAGAFRRGGTVASTPSRSFVSSTVADTSRVRRRAPRARREASRAARGHRRRPSAATPSAGCRARTRGRRASCLARPRRVRPFASGEVGAKYSVRASCRAGELRHLLEPLRRTYSRMVSSIDSCCAPCAPRCGPGSCPRARSPIDHVHVGKRPSLSTTSSTASTAWGRPRAAGKIVRSSSSSSS